MSAVSVHLPPLLPFGAFSGRNPAGRKFASLSLSIRRLLFQFLSVAKYKSSPLTLRIQTLGDTVVSLFFLLEVGDGLRSV